MEVKTLFEPGHGDRYQQSQHTSVDEVMLPVGATIPLQGYPEERLYYFTDGRGFMDIYPGDQYEIRQNTALWTTPMIPTEIRNTGPRPLYFAVFRTATCQYPRSAMGC